MNKSILSKSKSKRSKTYRSLNIEGSTTINSNKELSINSTQPATKYEAIDENQKSSKDKNLEPNDYEIQRISLPKAVVQMFVGIIGSGCLTLPYAVRVSGYFVGMALIIFLPILAYFTLDLLIIAAEYLPNDVPPSFQTLGQYAFGPKFSKGLLIMMTITYFGALIGYAVAWGALFDVAYQVLIDESESIYLWSVIIVTFGITLPLGLLRNLSALSYTSSLSAVFASYLAIVIVIKYIELCDTDEKIVTMGWNIDESALELLSTSFRGGCLWTKGWKFPNIFWTQSQNSDDSINAAWKGYLTAWPLILFAYTGHQFLLPVYHRLEDKSLPRMRRVFQIGNMTICMMYIVIATFAFLTFGPGICGNALINDWYIKWPGLVAVAAIGIGTACICASPVIVYNFRRSLAAFAWNQSPEQLPFKKHCIITILVVIVITALATLIQEITVVFGLLGSTVYAAMGYILPTCYFMKLVPKEKYMFRKFLAILQSIIVTILSITTTIWSFAGQPPSDGNCEAKITIG